MAASMVSTRYMNNEEMFTTEAKTITFPLLSKFRVWIAGLYRCHTSNRAERVRLTVFLGSLLMIFAIMPLHFFGLLGMPLIHLQAITLRYPV